MKASDLFIKCLEAEGVETIFGIPGEENADFMISLLDSSIEFVICRHEQAAAFMAATYGHLTGKPGVCLATLGPGATNLVTGVADANMDNAPVVAISGQAATTRLHKESHQHLDLVGSTLIRNWQQAALHLLAIESDRFDPGLFALGIRDVDPVMRPPESPAHACGFPMRRHAG